MKKGKSSANSIPCGPFNIGTWDQNNKRYRNGHHLYISDDKKNLEIYQTDADGLDIKPPICVQSLVSNDFIGILIVGNGLQIQTPKTATNVTIEISASKRMPTRLDEVGGGSTNITSFIGTDDFRQGLIIFSNALETTPSAGINLRFDESSNKLIIEY